MQDKSYFDQYLKIGELEKGLGKLKNWTFFEILKKIGDLERSSSGNTTVSEEELDSKLLCADSPDVAGDSGTKTNRGRPRLSSEGAVSAVKVPVVLALASMYFQGIVCTFRTDLIILHMFFVRPHQYK
jgi:hypothetical protein